MLCILHYVLYTHVIQPIGVMRHEAASGAVALIQRFGSLANLITHLHVLLLNGVCHTGEDGTPVCPAAATPSQKQLQPLGYWNAH